VKDGLEHCCSKNRIPDNVAPVKHFLGALTRALRGARHFALVEGSAIPTKARSSIRFRSGTQSDPCISSVTLSIMITTSNSPARRERDTQSITRCLTSHHRDFQVVPRANRTFSPARNPIPCASSSKGEPPVFRAIATGDLPPPPHRRVEILTAPFWEAAYCDLGRFH
jgi:hypothetical protein